VSEVIGSVAGEIVAGVRFGFCFACDLCRGGPGSGWNSLCRNWLDRRRAGDRESFRRRIAHSGVDWLGTAGRSTKWRRIGGRSVCAGVVRWRAAGLISGSGLGYGDRVAVAEGRLRYWECRRC